METSADVGDQADVRDLCTAKIPAALAARGVTGEEVGAGTQTARRAWSAALATASSAFVPGAHHRLLIGKLESEAGHSRRLVVMRFDQQNPTTSAWSSGIRVCGSVEKM
jgi:hypothetical protein